MPNPIINGSTQPIKQPTEIQYDPQRGVVRVERWESAGQVGLYGVASQLQALRVSYNFLPSPAKSVLVSTASGPEEGQEDVITDSWQILGNEIQKDLREHPRAATLSDAVITQINKGINDSTALSAMSPALSGEAILLFDRLKRGQTHYSIGQYVLRHTTNVANNYAVNVADQYVGQIYTTEQLITETTNADSWVFPLPGRMVYKLQNISAPSAKTGYTWGWRKLPSTENTGANNRIEITTEYWLEQWDTAFTYAAR